MCRTGKLILFVLLTQFSPVIFGQGSGRTWTRVDGATIEAEMMGVSGESVIVRQGNRRLELSFTTLSKQDLNFVYGWLQAAVKNQKTSGYPHPTLELKEEKRDRYMNFTVNGVRQMTTDVYLHPTVVAPFFCDGTTLHLRIIEPKEYGAKIDRATIAAANHIEPTVIPSPPRNSYLKIANNLAVSLAAVNKPLTWEGDGNLTTESKERLRLVQDSMKNVETSSIVMNSMGIRSPGAVERSGGGIRFQPTSEYWMPTFPKNANRSQFEQAFSRSQDALLEVQNGVKITPVKWKALSADIRVIEAIFRQCCGFLHEWRFVLEPVQIRNELYIELKDGERYYYRKTISE